MTDEIPRLSSDGTYHSLSLSNLSAREVEIDLSTIDYERLELRGAVETDALESLIHRWWSEAEQARSAGNPTTAWVFHQVIEDLEELLDDGAGPEPDDYRCDECGCEWVKLAVRAREPDPYPDTTTQIVECRNCEERWAV